MVIKKLLSLTNLMKAQTLYIYKLLKVVIVYKDKNLIFTIFYIVLLSFKGFNNTLKLIIMSFGFNLD